MKEIEVIKFCAKIDGKMKCWIMDSSENNTLKTHRIFPGERVAQFSIVETIPAKSGDPDTAGVFTHVHADMDIRACIAYTVEMNGDDLRILVSVVVKGAWRPMGAKHPPSSVFFRGIEAASRDTLEKDGRRISL